MVHALTKERETNQSMPEAHAVLFPLSPVPGADERRLETSTSMIPATRVVVDGLRNSSWTTPFSSRAGSYYLAVHCSGIGTRTHTGLAVLSLFLMDKNGICEAWVGVASP